MKYLRLFFILTFITGFTFAQDHLLISEIVVTPTAGEFIEIHNPTANSIDLSEYYLTDATSVSEPGYYYNIVRDSLAGGNSAFDFHVRFPNGASISPGEYQTVAINGDDFASTYSLNPTYEINSTDPNVTDMMVAFGTVGGSVGLTNGGEVVILYQWDGSSDLVNDIDYLVWGDKNEAVDKTNVSIDGPDPDTLASDYLADTPINQQISASSTAPHGDGESIQRLDATENGETLSNGNGITGHDETSEDLATSFSVGAPTPNSASAPTSDPPTISNITRSPSEVMPDDTVSVLATVQDDGQVTSVFLFFSVDGSAFDSVAMGNITGPIYEGFIPPQPANSQVEFFIQATDDEGQSTESSIRSYTVASPPQVVPIAVIQANPSAFETVIVEGVVTLGAGRTITSRTDAYVQDTSGRGINIFSFDPPGDPPNDLLVRGNLVRITGLVEEFQGVTEITDYTVELISTGNPLPAPLELTTQQANNTDLEGTYIKTTGTVTDIVPDNNGGTDITIDDGSGGVLVRVWDATIIDLSGLEVGDPLEVQAVMDLFQSTSQLTPGYQDELVLPGVNPGDGSGTATIDPDTVATSQTVTETITITGEPSFTLATVSVTLPGDWSWIGNAGDVQLSGSGFSGAGVSVDNNVITISSASVSENDPGTVDISNLTTPANDVTSTFIVKTATAGGTLLVIENSPTVVVGVGGEPVTPIADIQANPSAFGTVTVEGIITLGAGRTITTRTDAYIQDNSGRGINLFSFDPPGDPPNDLLVRGNRVRVTGTVEEFQGITEITEFSAELISTGNPVPEPLDLTTQQATNTDLEGTYIQTDGVIADIASFADATNITIDDGSGPVLIRVWASTGIDVSGVDVNDSLQVRAVMDVFQNNAQLTPGYQDEIGIPGALPGDGSGTATIVPDSVGQGESVSETITISGTPHYTLETVSINVPNDWDWVQLQSNVLLSGSGFTNASVSVQGRQIIISSAAITDVDDGVVQITSLTSPEFGVFSTFLVRTAVADGRLLTIDQSPVVKVGEGAPAGITPIAQIQNNTPAFQGQEVTIEGVVTVGAGVIAAGRVDGYIQDNSGRGINLFDFDPDPTGFIKRFNRLRVTGTVEEFSGITEITDFSVSLVSENNPLPEPLFVSTNLANDLSFEGTYMKVSGSVQEMEESGDAVNITVEDDQGTVLVRVWDATGINLGFLNVGDDIVVRGVMDVFQNSAQIIPAYQDEIVVPGETSSADGSGAASIPDSLTTVATGDTLPEFPVILAGILDVPIVNVQIEIPRFWQWSGNPAEVELSEGGLSDATKEVTVDELEQITRLNISSAAITRDSLATITFKNLITPADSVNSVFWIRTAGEGGQLRLINNVPKVNISGGERYWIYDLQTNSAEFSGSLTIRGVTTIGSGLLRKFSSAGDSLTTAYIQDESGRGINLFRFGLIDPLLQRGNLVEVEGTVTEFEGTTEIEYTSIELLAEESPLPEPINVINSQANSTRWDGTLLATEGVILERFAAGGGTSMEIGDGKGTTNIRIWDTADLDLSNFVKNSRILVQGVSNLFVTNGDSIFQLLPTYQDQIRLDPDYSPTLANVSLSVPAHPFAPGLGEEMPITYNAGSVANRVTIRIFDLGGRLVTTLLDEEAQFVQNTIEWDGRDRLKERVPLGTYICHLEVVEPQSGDKEKKMVPIVVGTMLER